MEGTQGSRGGPSRPSQHDVAGYLELRAMPSLTEKMEGSQGSCGDLWGESCWQLPQPCSCPAAGSTTCLLPW
eukprot:scaffold100206_cov19-Tisochrysis_lutea.AAC.2